MESNALEVIGEVIEVLPVWKYKIKLHGMDFELIGYKSGKMKKNNITIMMGDYVKVEINEYDNTQWRIVYRFKSRPTETMGEIEPGQSNVWNNEGE